MSKTIITPAERALPSAIISNTFIRLRSTQHADLTVFHARTEEVRVSLNWGGLLMTFRNAEAAQGVREALAAAKATLVHLPVDLGAPQPSDEDPYDRPTIAIDWTRRPSYGVMERSTLTPDNRRTLRWTDVYLGTLTLQILDRAAYHSTMDILKLAHQTAVAVCLDGGKHRADPTRDDYQFAVKPRTTRRERGRAYRDWDAAQHQSTE
ncbi:hypothetical protein [Mycolicibacterium peregrinum]|uniref:Uncharacterized protein n=1 Tax=Mycolicibacterium peregrinum TaxID=43304 RepID=A0A1A0VUB2_MYCPR|nr:hypothetical protein [Mycolicibacterium peregrinum]OBB86791.1 hypothetical protein A5779_00245 [Mycolicibacterium peregrinum]